MARRGLPEISAGSMADIAFLLLIFFLVTTTMDKEAGLIRILPEITPDVVVDPIPKKNVIEILLNDENKVLFEEDLIEISEVSERIEEMILNVDKRGDWPSVFDIEYADVQAALESAKKSYENADETEKDKKLKAIQRAELRVKAFEVFGQDFKKSSHVVSIQSTKGSEYKYYIELSDQILKAYKNLKVKLAKKYWSKNWKDLTTEQKDMLDLVYPSNISEAQTVEGGI